MKVEITYVSEEYGLCYIVISGKAAICDRVLGIIMESEKLLVDNFE